jgi:hypothetical protein
MKRIVVLLSCLAGSGAGASASRGTLSAFIVTSNGPGRNRQAQRLPADKFGNSLISHCYFRLLAQPRPGRGDDHGLVNRR